MKLGNAIEDRTSPRNIWNIKQNAGYATCTIEWVPPKLDCTFGTVRKFQMAFLFVLGFVPWELNETGYELSFAYATKSYAKWIKPLRTFAPLVLWWMITAARAQSINFLVSISFCVRQENGKAISQNNRNARTFWAVGYQSPKTAPNRFISWNPSESIISWSFC